MAKRSKIQTTSLPKLQSFWLALLLVLFLFVVLWALMALIRVVLG